MDWTPATEAARAEHDEVCPIEGCDWRYCPRTTPVPEVARRMGLIEEIVTIADRQAAAAAASPQDRPDLDEVWCVCGQKRRGHSMDGSRCFHCVECMAEGGFRDRDRPDTWGTAQRRALSLNPEDTGQQFSGAVERPDWFRHGD